MTMLNLDLRHLQEQKLEDSIQSCFNPCCFCNDDTKSFTHCSSYTHDLYKMVYTKYRIHMIQNTKYT